MLCFTQSCGWGGRTGPVCTWQRPLDAAGRPQGLAADLLFSKRAIFACVFFFFLLECTLLPIAPRCQVKQDFLNMRRKDRVEVVDRRHRTSNKRCATPTAHAPCPTRATFRILHSCIGRRGARDLDGVKMWRGWWHCVAPRLEAPPPCPDTTNLCWTWSDNRWRFLDAHGSVRRFGVPACPSPPPVLLVRKSLPAYARATGAEISPLTAAQRRRPN